MKKLELKIVINLITVFLLSVILLISVSFGWYVNNENVNANGINAIAASESLSVTNSGAYRQNITDDPYPEQKPETDIVGVLSGDVVYFSISLISDEIGVKNIEVKIAELFGGEYFTRQPIPFTGNYSEIYALEDGQDKSVGTYQSTENNTYLVYFDNKNTEQTNDDYYYIIKLINNVYYKTTLSLKNGKFESNGDETRLDAVPVIPNSYVTTYLSRETNVYKTFSDADGEYYLKVTSDGIQKIYIYQTVENNNPIRYNMIDVYSYEVYKVFGRRYIIENDKSTGVFEDVYYQIQNTPGGKIYFDKGTNGLAKSLNMYSMFKYDNWCNDRKEDPENYYDEITFTFRIVFDYAEFAKNHSGVNMSSLSNKKIEFKNILIYETKDDGTEVEE